MQQNRRAMRKSLGIGMGAALLAMAIFAGCAEGQQATCRVGTECSSGVCGANGLCKDPEPNVDGGSVDGSRPDASPTDSGPVTDASKPDGTTPGDAGGCGNRDGIIDESENPSVIGAKATYKVSTETDFDPAGTKAANGAITWDFTGALTGDRDIVIESLDPTLGWYKADFAGTNLAARLGGESELLGVYNKGSGALRLKGIVSPAAGTSSTKLSYDQPITALGYPVKVGSTFTSKALVTGTAQNITFSSAFGTAYNEQWDGSVDATGTAKTPFGTFAVNRVKILLTRTSQFGTTPGTLASSRVTFLYVAECYGVVAAVASKDNETSGNFTRAAEVRRLSL
jgi:hypothetical protein